MKDIGGVGNTGIGSLDIPAGLSDVLFEESGDGIILMDGGGRCTHANKAACRLLGYLRDELLRQNFSILFRQANTGSSHIEDDEPELKNHNLAATIMVRKDGTTLPIDGAVHTLPDGSFVLIFKDASQSKTVQRGSHNLLRIYMTLSGVNDSILHARNTESLFRDICDVAVRVGGYALASMGVVDETGDFIRLKAWKGGQPDLKPYDNLAMNTQPAANELLTRAVRTGDVTTSEDLQSEERATFWHSEVFKRGRHSAVAIPFTAGRKVTGVLGLLTSEKETFGEGERELFTAMGRSISFSLSAIQGEEERRAAESALKESEERYRSAFNHTTIGIYRTTADGQILMANRALVQMLGYGSLEELRLRDLKKEGFEPAYPRDKFISQIEKDGVIIGLEAAWTHRSGKTIYVRESARAVRGPDGKTRYYEGTIEDITQRKLAEKTIGEKNILMEEMSRMARIGGWEFTVDDMQGSWTEETARIHGLDPADKTNVELGMSFYEGDSKRRIEAAVKEAVEKGKPYDLELEMTAADGMHKWVRTIAHPIIQGGKVIKVRGTFQDITDSKRTQDKIRYLTRLYATLSQVNQTIVRTRSGKDLYKAICDVAIKFGEFPLAAVGLYDRERHSVDLVEWKGSRITDKPYTSVDIELPQYIDGLLSAAIRKNKVVTSGDVPTTLETKHWREVLMRYRLNAAAAVPFGPNGEVTGVLTLYVYETDIFVPEVIGLLEEMALDISFALNSMNAYEERRRNEAALAEEKNRLARIAEMAPGLIHSYRMRPDGSASMPFASAAIRDIYGFLPEDVADDLSPVFAHFHPDDVRHINESIAESARTMTPWHDEFRYLHPEKGEVWIEGRSMPVREADGSITWHGFIQDVTERKRVERAVRSSEEKFRSIMAQMTDTVFVSNSRALVSYISPSCEQMFGFSAEEMLGRDFREFLFEDDVALAMQMFRKTQRTGRPTKDLELRMKRKDGSVFRGELDATLYKDDSITGSMGVIRDITARKKAEKELRDAQALRIELERQLIQAQKLESLGTLAGGIAHDFNNLLGVIMGYSALLKEDGLDAATAERSIDSIEKASERGAALVKQLLTFARKTETEFKPVSMNEIVADTVRFLEETFPKTITIEPSLEDGVPNVIGDTTQLHQVLMNLCINARDALPEGGSVLISCARVGQDDAVVRASGHPGRDYVLVSVTDTGIGMDKETQRKVFDPFFTTKGPGKGTGLGLALVYSIVQAHGGLVRLRSEPEEGTTFSIYFPASLGGQRIGAAAGKKGGQEPGGSETILVIEDEKMLLQMLQDILVPQGYSILMARDGEEGIEVYNRHKSEIAAVITDLGLPRMGGDRVFHHIRTIRPGAKVIIASGFIDPDVRLNLTKAGVDFFIQKPYVPSEILHIIRHVIDDPEA